MDNIVSYAESNFDTFETQPFCSVDSLILSWISYFHFPCDILAPADWTGIRFSDLLKAEYFQDMFGHIWGSDSSKALLFALASSPRFRDIRICGYTQQYDEVLEKQFSAVTFSLRPDLSYIAFRGTDSTFIGWKEDFNMAFKSPVPAQEAAAEYLNTAASHCEGSLLVGGHSKGGNLAVYSAVKSSGAVRSRIIRAYSHDGPGFQESFLSSPDFLSMKERIEKTIPQSSLIGMLFENQEDFNIVKSNAFTLWQHDPFSWSVSGNTFSSLERLNPGARYMDRTLNTWISGISESDRERFVDSLYTLLNSSDATTFDEFKSNLHTNVPAVMQAASKLDPDTRSFLLQTIKELASLGVKNFPQLFGRIS